ncbi:MAG: adenylate/guanylate cyclase domain-containing protein [Proteobacteria bacterium]|nr:adenylate/guanylate cyclase domain-containing protein [Pseudomonadota bacterium]
MKKETQIRIILNLFAALFLVALTGEYGSTRISIIETLEKQNYDWRILRHTPEKTDDIVIVDIDRDTLRNFGSWPFTRDLFADFNRQLFNKYRVRVAAYALPFSEPDDTSLRLLTKIEEYLIENQDDTEINNFRFKYAMRQSFRELSNTYNYDSNMVQSMQDKPIILGHIFDETGRVQGALPYFSEFLDQEEAIIPSDTIIEFTREWPLLRGYSGNLPEYLTATNNQAGHINLTVDEDGVVRRAPYFINHARGYYPSLPLVVFQHLFRKNYTIDLDSSSINGIRFGARQVPINKNGHMYINYLGVGGRNVDFASSPNAVFPYISFVDVVQGKVPLEMLDDKIVFIGSSSEQLRDLYSTPTNPSLPGVEILATQLKNLMDENLLKRNDNTFFLETLVLLFLVVLLSVLFSCTSPLLSVIFLLVALVGYIQFVIYQWNVNYEIWTMLPTVITLTGLFLINTIIGFIFEWRSNLHLQNTFGQYVPPEFAKKIGGSSSKINLEGEGRELSVLFSDVRDFTSISETLSPRELTLLMNRMLTSLTEVIHQHGGTVDKYIGDAVMAFWNAPLDDPKHAKNSVLAALDMQTAMQELSDSLEKKGFKKMELGVGICTGDANVGNMGSNLRMTYTAIGDTVNLASRTESLTKFYSCSILVTETTRDQCAEDIAFRPVDLVQVKGRKKPVLLYQPIGLSHLLQAEQIKNLEHFEQMRQLYLAGDFNAANEKLQSYIQLAPDDRLANVYQLRIKDLLENPPQEWDGIVIHTSK